MPQSTTGVNILLILQICNHILVVKCPALTVNRLVKTSPKSCVTSQMKYNATCFFACPQGYQLQGPSYKQCGPNGQWMGNAKTASCIGELLAY